MARLRTLVHPERARRQPVDLNRVVSGALDLLKMEELSAGINIIPVLADGLPSVALDEVQFSQALLNLLRNACEAVRGCEPARREVRVITRLEDSGNVSVEVRDRGYGIQLENLNRVFEPLFTTKSNGMGVGLSLCRRIVEAHGGTLTAQNRPDGSGAFFQMTLCPVVQSNP
jgi:signal transduction histidine kinase